MNQHSSSYRNLAVGKKWKHCNVRFCSKHL